MKSKWHPARPRAADEQHERTAANSDSSDAAIAHRLANGISYADPADNHDACYDPYNTGPFRVLSDRPRRRTLDDMRKLDTEIRSVRKP